MSYAATSSGGGAAGFIKTTGLMVVILAAACAAALALYQKEVSFLAALDHAANASKSELLMSASVEDIITEDRSRLETTVQQFHERDAQFYGYRVTNEDGAAMMSWQRPNAPKPQQILTFLQREYPVQRSVNPIVFEGETYGMVTVEWDQSVSAARRDSHAYLMAGMVAILCVGFSLFGYWIGHRRA